MAQFTSLLIGILILILGFPIGNYLARETKEELKTGQFWFKIVIIFGCLGVILSLIIGNDVLLFTFAFIAIVTSRSLMNKRKKSK